MKLCGAAEMSWPTNLALQMWENKFIRHKPQQMSNHQDFHCFKCKLKYWVRSDCPFGALIMCRYSSSPSVGKVPMQRVGPASLQLWSTSGGNIKAQQRRDDICVNGKARDADQGCDDCLTTKRILHSSNKRNVPHFNPQRNVTGWNNSNV